MCTCKDTIIRVMHYSITVRVVCDVHSTPPKPGRLSPQRRDRECRHDTSGFSPRCFGTVDYTSLTMYINGALPPDRRLETAMHELGHLVCWSLSDTVNDEAGANVAACFLRAAKDFSFAVLVYDFDNAVRDLVEDLRDIGSEDN